ncbi:hypothetical protein [Nocardia thraciensis]
MDTSAQGAHKPIAVCLIRSDVPGLEAPRHAMLAQRHAAQLGYTCLYTVRPPADSPDPIEYGLGMAAGLNAKAMIVYDLATVNDNPARVCDMFDLETVNPPTTWAAALATTAGLDHRHPEGPLTAPEAHRIMRQHIGCRADECPRKASAHNCLVRTGKIVPPVDTLRERAAAKGMELPPAITEPSQPSGPDLQTLLDVLDGLADSTTDSQLLAARLSPGSEG